MGRLLNRWSWVATLCFCVAAAFLSARIVNTLASARLSPLPSLDAVTRTQPPPASAAPPLDLARAAKAFDVPLATGEQAIPAPETPPERRPSWSDTPSRSTLRARVVGTAVASPERWSLCQLLAADAGAPEIVAVGGTFLGARVYTVERDRVLLDRDGNNEFLDRGEPDGSAAALLPAPGQGGVRQLSAEGYALSRAALDGALNDTGRLFTQVRAMPVFKNGAIVAYKLFSIDPSSLFAKLGLQNGDQLRRINGYDLGSAERMLELLQKLRDAARVELDLERGGAVVRKQVTIE
jgi:general secretion pathway protein C